MWTWTRPCAATLIGIFMLGACDRASERGATCTRDPQLMGARRECATDDLCPCGTHCDLGVCVATCNDDARCASGACDEDGRCLEDVVASRSAALTQAGPLLALSANGLTLLDDDTERALRISAVAEATRARFVAKGGLQVRCNDTADLADECVIDSITREGVTVWVQRSGEASTQAPALDVIDVDNGVQRVSIATSVLAVPSGRGGLYKGSIWLESDPMQPELGALDIGHGSVSVAVWEEEGAKLRIAIEDDDKAVLSSVVSVTATAAERDNVSVTLPRVQLLLRTSPDAPGAEVEGAEIFLARANATLARVGNGTLDLQFPTAFVGLGAGGDEIARRLVITAARVSDTEDRPRVDTADGSSTLTNDRATSFLFEAVGKRLETVDFAKGGLTALRPFLVDTVGNGSSCLASAKVLAAANEARVGVGQLACYVGLYDAFFEVAVEPNSLGKPPHGARDPRYGQPRDYDCPSNGVYDHVDCEWAYHPPEGGNPTITGDCDDVSKTFKCVVNLVDRTMLADVPGGAAGAQRTWNVQKTCVFLPTHAPTEAACVAAVSCLGATSFDLPVDYATDYSPTTGDPACAVAALPSPTPPTSMDGGTPMPDGGTPMPYGGFTEPVPDDAPSATAQPLFGALENPPDDVGDLRDQCVRDLGLNVAKANVGAGNPATPLVFKNSGCLNRAQFYLALDRAFVALRAGRHDPAAEALGHRLVQNLLSVYALTGRVALNAYREESLLGKIADPTSAASKALDQSLSVWSIVLHPRVATALLGLTPAVLAAPDPRPRLPGLPRADDAVARPRIGVAVDLLDTLSEQMELTSALLERSWFEGNGARISARRDTAAELTRIASAVGPLAGALRSRALGAGATTWDTAWKTSAGRFVRIAKALLRQSQLVASGANPIGIEDADLPLYYGGDPLEPNARFSAVSRYLIGTGNGSLGVAPKAIEDARSALDDVRDRWHERRSVIDVSESRIQDIGYRYGELITGYCGASIAGSGKTNYANADQPPCRNPGSQSVLACDAMDTEVCFVEEACRAREDDVVETLTSETIAKQLCVAAHLPRTLTTAQRGLAPELSRLLEAKGDDLYTLAAKGRALPVQLVEIARPSANARIAVVNVGGTNYRLPLDALGQVTSAVPERALSAQAPSMLLPETIPQNSLQLYTERCDNAAQQLRDRRPTVSPGACVLADQCAVAEVCRFQGDVGSCQGALNDPLDAVDCYYDGAISEQALAVRKAATDVELARNDLSDMVRSYDVSQKACLERYKDNQGIESMNAAHEEVMNTLDAARTACDAVATAAGVVKDCTATDANIPSCVAGAVEGAAAIASQVVEFKMNEAERLHQLKVEHAENQADLRECLREAELYLVGGKSAVLRIKQAMRDQASSVINLRGQKSYTKGLFDEGREAIAAERARLERSVPSQFAISEAAERFANRFKYARRVTYLAVRAVEYEFQQSLAQRQDALAASSPDDLENVVESMSGFVNAGQVNGGRAAPLKAVISLREQLLLVGDHSGDPPGEKRKNSVLRFRDMLKNAEVVVDDTGRPLGRRIPFGIYPLGSTKLLGGQNVAIFADNDCAERVWSVNAAILGDKVYRGDSASFTRLDLLKQNTFFSRWCGGEPGAELQVASVRPAVNLFLDPASTGTKLPTAQQLLDYTRARMQPYLNVSRAQFEQEQYAQEGTPELAGRGLYGDYALFIPETVIAQDDGPGLQLDNVDDVLLRLDYVSVARN